MGFLNLPRFHIKKDIYLVNGRVFFSKVFVCRSIIELMEAEIKRPFTPTKCKTKNLTLKDNSYFIPNDLYQKLAEYFDAFFGKKPDKNVFYICVRMLEKDGKIKKIKEKRQVYYKLV